MFGSHGVGDGHYDESLDANDLYDKFTNNPNLQRPWIWMMQRTIALNGSFQYAWWRSTAKAYNISFRGWPLWRHASAKIRFFT